MKKTYLFVVMILCTFFISCSHGSKDNMSALKFLDIVDAKTLYISTSSANRSARSGSETQRIFKITDDGYTEEVKYLDDGKEAITLSLQPTAIYNINSDYIFVGFGRGESIESSYLVRKSDGAVFSMEDSGNVANIDLLKTDNNDNLYYLTYFWDDTGYGRQKIQKINLKGINVLSATTVSASTDDVQSFEVDGNGNIIYECFANTYGNYVCRLRKTNGSFVNNTDIGLIWVGLDGCFYHQSNSQNDSKESEYNSETNTWTHYSYPIKKLTIDSSYNISDEIYAYIPYTDNAPFVGGYKITVKNKIYFISENIVEVYNSSGSPRVVTLQGLSINRIIGVSSTENFYYIAGMDSTNKTFIIKINPVDDSYTHLLTQNDYDIFSFTASETDGIIFNALRMSDGKKVIGKVGINGGTVTMLDEESDVKISYLERIN